MDDHGYWRICIRVKDGCWKIRYPGDSPLGPNSHVQIITAPSNTILGTLPRGGLSIISLDGL
jgi:hypothetical protein